MSSRKWKVIHFIHILDYNNDTVITLCLLSPSLLVLSLNHNSAMIGSGLGLGILDAVYTEAKR